MKKKISLLGLVLILVFSLAGCGSSKESPYDQATMESYAEVITQSFSAMTAEEFQYYRELSDLAMDLTMLNSGLPISGDDFIGMMDAWEAGIVDCGTITEIGTYELTVSNTSATLTADFAAEDRNGNIQFTFDEDMNLESLTINPEFSMGEILAKAGMNTLLGMGTVFTVLIFIAFVISLFKYIPVIQGLFSKKAKEEVPAPTVAETVSVEETVETDDTELIAVIAAAIAAAEGTSTDGFVVRSIKRRKTNNWK